MKKRLLALLLTVVMGLSLVACGGSGEDTTDEADATTETGEIEACTINFTYWADNTDYSALMQDIIAKFNEENEYGIEVVGEEIPWDGGGFLTHFSTQLWVVETQTLQHLNYLQHQCSLTTTYSLT